MSHSSLPPFFRAGPRIRPFYILPGTRVGAYVIVDSIAHGGGQMAYLAEAPDGGRVVLKMSLYPAGAPDTRVRVQYDRFLRQVALLLQLRNVPGVAHVLGHDMYPYASESGYPYIVQEWIQGSVNVLDWFRMEPHPLKVVVAAWMLLGNACAEMHRRSYCHRDLKPDNILMKPVRLGAAKIVDFDSAVSLASEPLTDTGAGHWPGTRRYYSPEVAKAILRDWNSDTGRPEPFQYEPASDLWALGVILYEALTGAYPFEEGDNDEELFESIARHVPKRPRALNPDVPFGLDKITMRLLRKDPAKRPDGDEMVADLESLLATPEDWERPFQTPRGRGDDGGPSRPWTERPTPTPRLAYRYGRRDSRACRPAPTAIALAEPRPLVVRGPRALLRLVPVPSVIVAVPQPVQTAASAARRRPLARRLLFPLAAALALAFAGPSLEKGPMLLRRAKVAVIAAGSALLSACPILTGKVRADDRTWLSTKCPADALKAARELALVKPQTDASVVEGSNVIWHDNGTAEVKDGTVEVSAGLQTPGEETAVRLFGELRTGSDGASIHLTKARRCKPVLGPCQYEDGPGFPICAIVYLQGDRDTPGIPKAEAARFPPASELHPGYMLVDTFAALMVEVAE